ncbi:hypothetical protein PC114_g7645 [Phytophthora cactorum]|nr:hypothetical protein PC114_g7645 [Phytophthora cactorum]
MQRNPLRSRFVPSRRRLCDVQEIAYLGGRASLPLDRADTLSDRTCTTRQKGILKRLGSQPATINQIARPSNPEEEPVKTQITLVEVSGDHNTEPTGSTSEQVARMTAADEVEKTEEPATSTQVSPDRQLTYLREPGTQPSESGGPSPDRGAEDEQVCISEGGELFAEDVEDQMAVLPEVTK